MRWLLNSTTGYYDKNSYLTLNRIFEYFNNGDRKYEKNITSDGATDEFIYINDTLKNTREFKSFRNDTLNHWSITHYDYFGNEVETEFFNTDSSFFFTNTTRYFYDSLGNWIEKWVYSGNKVVEKKYRTIEYYK